MAAQDGQSLDRQIKKASKDFETFPEWKKKFYKETTGY